MNYHADHNLRYMHLDLPFDLQVFWPVMSQTFLENCAFFVESQAVNALKAWDQHFDRTYFP